MQTEQCSNHSVKTQSQLASNTPLESTADAPDWLLRYLEKRLSDQADTKPYEQYIFELLAYRDLSTTDKLAAVIIWLHADRETGKEAWPSQELIAWLLNRNVETVRKSTRKLEEHGFLSTVWGKSKRSSRYTLLVRNHALRDIPKRTLDELVRIFHPQTVEVSPPQKRGCDPQAVEGGTSLCNLPEEPAKYIVINDDDYTSVAGGPSSGMVAGKTNKRKRKSRQGNAAFDFAPEETTLELVFESGCVHDTEDVADAEILETVKSAAAKKVGAALLTDDGIFTVRMMIAAMMTQTGCSASAALEYIQGRIWQRIGQTDDRLNCYSLIFKPICGDLHVQGDAFGDLMPMQEYFKSQIEAYDYAGRINHSLYSDVGIKGLQRLVERYGEDLTLETITGLVNEPGGSDSARGHIITWAYFHPAIKENERRAQIKATGLAPGDLLGHGMKLEVPF